MFFPVTLWANVSQSLIEKSHPAVLVSQAEASALPSVSCGRKIIASHREVLLTSLKGFHVIALISCVQYPCQVGIIISHLKLRKEKPRNSMSCPEFPEETMAGPEPESGLSLEPCCPPPSPASPLIHCRPQTMATVKQQFFPLSMWEE